MASCSTERWVSTSPYVKLDVSIIANTANQTTLKYTLYYIASSAASTSVAKGYSVTIGGAVVSSGAYSINGKTGTNIICTGETIINETKTTQTISCSCGFAFNLTWSGVYCGTKTASSTISIGAKNKYTISYNLNGGSGVVSSQIKWHGEPLTLSSIKPTRTGYSFLGWATSNTATSANYAAGANYTANSSATLYAVWEANTYTITYNANGGSGVPSSQQKTHDVALTLRSGKPFRTNYTFLGWSTTATGIVMYEPGESFTKNANTTLYAVWGLSYTLPKIYNVTVYWDEAHEPEIDANGNVRRYVSGGYYWETIYQNPTVNIAFYTPDGTEVASSTITMTGGITHNEYGPEVFPSESFLLNPDVTYTVKITLTDNGGSTTVSATLAGNIFPIDVLAGGKGISFGGPASLEDTAHFQWDVRFDKSVYGNVPGMYRLPEIKANDDFNNYMTTGCWAVYKNANAATIANIPVAMAGRLEVWSATGEGIRAEQWSYLRQKFIPYNNSNATWERDIARGEDNVWIYYEWHRTTLTPYASEKIYSKAAITAVLSSNVTLGIANTYTKIPMNNIAIQVGFRLTNQNNAIEIGENINLVKISGQTLVKCGSVTGNRHARIQIVKANGTTTSLAWVCLYSTAQSNTVFAFTPIIASVSEGDIIQMVYYTSDTADANQSGSSVNGWQTYLTVEEL